MSPKHEFFWSHGTNKVKFDKSNNTVCIWENGEIVRIIAGAGAMALVQCLSETLDIIDALDPDEKYVVDFGWNSCPS
jgi:hypothetical protein